MYLSSLIKGKKINNKLNVGKAEISFSLKTSYPKLYTQTKATDDSNIIFGYRIVTSNLYEFYSLYCCKSHEQFGVKNYIECSSSSLL